jgi:excisionase family DNA binding protein
MTREDALTLTVTETAALLRISRNTAYSLIAQGQIPSIRLGKRILVPKNGLQQMLAEASHPTGDAGRVAR